MSPAESETGKFRRKAGRKDKPLPVDGNPRTILAARLRELKSACGSPTYDELSNLSRVYKTGLLDAAGVTRLPPWYVIKGYVEGCWEYYEGRLSAPFPDAGDLRRWQQLYRDAGGAVPCDYPLRETAEQDEQPEPQLLPAGGVEPVRTALESPPAARPPIWPSLRLTSRAGWGCAGLALGLLCLVGLTWSAGSPSRPVTSPSAARCAYVTALPAPVLSAPSANAALVKREDLGDGIEILPLSHPPGWWPVYTPGDRPDHSWMPAGVLSPDVAGARPCADNPAVAAVTKYNSDSAEEQFAVGSDCRVYHRWQPAGGGQFSRWTPMGGCAPSRQGLAVGMNGDGELVAFVISPDHAVRYKSQSRPSLGPWTGWTSIGGDVSTGLRVVSAPDGSSPVRVFATDKSGKQWENDQTQGTGNCCWSGWRKVQPARPAPSRRLGSAIGVAVLLREVGDPDFLDGPLTCPVGGR